jgi:hypothetical protein
MSQSNAARRDDTEEHGASERAGRKPVDKFHDGPVHVSIWENPGPKGEFRTASFQLRYKDKQEQWQTGYSYSASDLAHLEKAAKEARDRINTWQQGNKASHQPG